MIWVMPRVLRVALIGALCAVVAACSARRNMQRLADGTFALECTSTLAACLEQVEQACADHGYEVVEGGETRSRTGPEGIQRENLSSTARVRCRSADALIVDDEKPPLPEPEPVVVAPAAPTQPIPPPQHCVPGQALAYTGPGACKGGQSCNADGTGYLPCDCGADRVDDATSEPSVDDASTDSVQTE